MRNGILILLLGLTLMGCGLFFAISEGSEAVEKVGKTVNSIDKDGDGILSSFEIVMWMISGWIGGRVTETGVVKTKEAVKAAIEKDNDQV
jgi:hypothetical protein